MFGMGMPEIILILAVALIFIGPKKLPDLARSLGKAVNEFKKAGKEFKKTIDIDEETKGIKESIDEIKSVSYKSDEDKKEDKKEDKSDDTKEPKEKSATVVEPTKKEQECQS